MFLVLTIITILGALISLDKNKSNKKQYVLFMCIAYIFVSGFRSREVGTDTPGYVDAFLRAPKLSMGFILESFQKKESFYYIFQSLVRSVTDSYTIFFLLISLFYIACVGFFIYKYSKMPMISFLLFMSMGYFSFSMAGIRQTIAMGFLLLALHQILENKYLKGLILIILASLFHVVSWVFLWVYLLKVFPLNKKFIFAIILLCGVFYLYGDFIWKELAEKIWGDSRNYDNEFGGISTLILLIFVVFATLLFYPRMLYSTQERLREKRKEQDRLFFRMLLLAVAFQILAVFQANAFRVSMIFHMPMLALLPNVLNLQTKTESRYLAGAIVVVALCAQLFLITANASDILPFTFFWQV